VLHDGSPTQHGGAERQVARVKARVYYFRKHHHGFIAWLAKGILCASLALRCLSSTVKGGRRTHARVYARGVESVWAS
jgi:hypothetical protein